jgi:hypothetical protein
MAANTPHSETVEFPHHPSPIGVFFVVVPTLVVVFGAIVIASYRLPWIMYILVATVMGCAAVLAKTAIDEIGKVKIEWSAQGVTVHRILGSESFYWSHVERVELLDPGATFGDNGRHDEGRSAIGIFIRDPQRKDRPLSDTPDAMLVSRVGEQAGKIPKLAERLANAKRFGGGKDGRKLGGSAPSQPGRAAKQFRRTASAAAG